MIPELPIISPSVKTKCSACKKPIAGWVVAESSILSCPSCNTKLKSNYKTAIKKAFVIGVILYLVMFLLVNTKTWESDTLLIIYFLAGTVPLLVSYMVFKVVFKLKIL